MPLAFVCVCVRVRARGWCLSALFVVAYFPLAGLNCFCLFVCFPRLLRVSREQLAGTPCGVTGEPAWRAILYYTKLYYTTLYYNNYSTSNEGMEHPAKKRTLLALFCLYLFPPYRHTAILPYRYTAIPLYRYTAIYQALKKERSECMWRALEKIIPDVRQRTEVELVATPLTHEFFNRRFRGDLRRP